MNDTYYMYIHKVPYNSFHIFKIILIKNYCEDLFFSNKNVGIYLVLLAFFGNTCGIRQKWRQVLTIVSEYFDY